MTTDWKAKEAVSYLTAQPMREITTRTQQLDFPSSSRLRGSCRLFLEANTATRRPEKSTAERSRTKKINLELQLASKKPAVLQKSRKVRNGRTGRLEGFNGTAGQSQQHSAAGQESSECCICSESGFLKLGRSLSPLRKAVTWCWVETDREVPKPL